MELQIHSEAQEMLQKVRQPKDTFILDYEDAIGPFTENAVSCQLYPSFRVLFVPGFKEEWREFYDESISTELGECLLKKTSLFLLDKNCELIVDPIYHRLQVRSDSGILVANLPVKRMGE